MGLVRDGSWREERGATAERGERASKGERCGRVCEREGICGCECEGGSRGEGRKGEIVEREIVERARREERGGEGGGREGGRERGREGGREGRRGLEDLPHDELVQRHPRR